MPSQGLASLPGAARRAEIAPSSGKVLGATEKFSLHCSTTGPTTPRLLMISISASVGGRAPDRR